MSSFRSKPVGWRYESQRHSLAAKGVATKQYLARFRRYYPASPAIGRASSGSLSGALQNVFAERERRKVTEPIRLSEKLRGVSAASSRLAQRPLTDEESRWLEHERFLAVSSGPAQGRFFGLSQMWIRQERESADELARLRGKYEYALRGKAKRRDPELREVVKDVKAELKKYDKAKKNLDRYHYPEVFGDKDTLRWAREDVQKTTVRKAKK